MKTARERPFYVEGEDGPLFGIHRLIDGAKGTVIVCPGGWHGGLMNANRLPVRLSEHLGDTGRSVVRFDWRGAGESPGFTEYFRIDEPAPGDTLAIAALGNSNEPVSLVGVCIGSRSALAAAPDIENLESVVLVSFPFPAASTKQKRADRIGFGQALREGVRPSVIRGWFDPATRSVYKKFIRLRWAGLLRKVGLTRQDLDPAVVQAMKKAAQNDIETLTGYLKKITARGVRVLFLYGESDASYEHFQQVKDDPALQPLLESEDSPIDVRVVPGDLTGYSSLASQDTMIEYVTGWFRDLP